MNRSHQSLLRVSLGIPAIGEGVTFRKGPMELRLEHHQGGLCVVTPQGGERKRHYLGLPADGWLELSVRAPDHRVRVHLTDRLTLVSGGRLRGYLSIPLPHRLSWCGEDGRVEALLDVAPRELQTSWLGEGVDGGYVHDTWSGFHLERHGLRADTVALVPVVIMNHCDHVISPADLTISIRERDIRELEGQIITAPRRLHFGEQQRVAERIRSLPRRSA